MTKIKYEILVDKDKRGNVKGVTIIIEIQIMISGQKDCAQDPVSPVIPNSHILFHIQEPVLKDGRTELLKMALEKKDAQIKHLKSSISQWEVDSAIMLFASTLHGYPFAITFCPFLSFDKG